MHLSASPDCVQISGNFLREFRHLSAPVALQTGSILGLYTVSKLLRGRLENPPKASKLQKLQIRPTVPASSAPSPCVPASVSGTWQFFAGISRICQPRSPCKLALFWVPHVSAPFALQTGSISGLYTVSKLLRGRFENPAKALKLQK